MNQKPDLFNPAARLPKGGVFKPEVEDLSGVSLGRYLLLRRLGQGGMGVVYEAEDNLLNRRVAVKLLPHTNRPQVRLLERFFVEAQVAARLNHPNIIGIYDIGERNGTFFIVMELLNEMSLGSYLRRQGALSWQEATRVAADCCAALHEAHLVGLVHRDIKPDNILCSPAGIVKVADFGLVKELLHENPEGIPFTQEDAVVGSPQYMSPEQCRSQPVDSRSDIYSLGATYYSMLTGRPPYGFGVPMELMVHHCSSPTPDPREHAPDVPEQCVEILNLAMQKHPDDRFSTAEDFRAALEMTLDGAHKISNVFLVPATSVRQPARHRHAEELRAALEAEHSDGVTVDTAQPSVDDTEPEPPVFSDSLPTDPTPSLETRQSPKFEFSATPEAAPPPDAKIDAKIEEKIDAKPDNKLDKAKQTTKPMAKPPTKEEGLPQYHDPSDEKRMKLLEAALSQAPTMAITPPSASAVLRRRHGKSAIAAVALLALLVIALLGGQFGRLLSDDAGVKAAVRPTIKVGVLHSLSGPMSPVARPVVDATLLAIDDLNEQGGLLGRSIEALIVDGKSDAESFAAETERLITRDQVQVIFGGWHDDVRRGIRQVVEAHNNLLLYPGDSEGLEDSPNIFYLGGVPSQRIEPALRYSVEKLGYKRFFLIGSELRDARAQSAMLNDTIHDLGGKVVGEGLLPMGALDMNGFLKKIAAAQPDLIISTLRGDANVSFFRAWQMRDKKLRELHVLSLELDENILTLLDGVDMTKNFIAGSYFEGVPRPESRVFVDRFRHKYGAHHVVTEAMEAAYAGVYLWAQAVRTANDWKAPSVRKALKSQKLQAPSAQYQFDDNNNYAWKSFHLVRIAPGNKLELLESSPALIRPQLFPGSRSRAEWDELYGHM